MFDRNLFAVQLQLLDEFIHHLTYRRALEAAQVASLHLPAFWSYTSTAHLLCAASAWCMVFGAANNNNTTHWRMIFQDDEAIVSSFRGRLRIELGFDEAAWKTYHEDMVAFRDNYVAHRHANPPVVPNFDTALGVVFAYDSWVRETIAPDVLDYPLLRTDAGALEETVRPYTRALIDRALEIVI